MGLDFTLSLLIFELTEVFVFCLCTRRWAEVFGRVVVPRRNNIVIFVLHGFRVILRR